MKLPLKYSKIPITERWKIREEYIKQQKGMCMWCRGCLKQPPPKEITEKKIKWSVFPKDFLKHPIHLQHCHKTGNTEGAVHAYCNAVMWQYHNR